MEYLNNLLEKRHTPDLVLSVLFFIYLVLGLKVPDSFAFVIDSTIGKIIIALSALMLFAYSNPILGVLSLLVAYQLIKGASTITGMAGLDEYNPTESKKWTPFAERHQFPYTLEQEMVKKMTTQKFNTEYVKAPYRPVLEDTHDAEHISI
jgi:hypothetical protein